MRDADFGQVRTVAPGRPQEHQPHEGGQSDHGGDGGGEGSEHAEPFGLEEPLQLAAAVGWKLVDAVGHRESVNAGGSPGLSGGRRLAAGVGSRHLLDLDLAEPRRPASRSPFRRVSNGANEAGAVLQQYWAQNKITRPYFDTEEGSDLDGFLAESPRHPVFRIEGTA
jgi:hypothetical protein